MAENIKPTTGKAPLHLLPLRPLSEVARVFEHGNTKYEPWNWTEDNGDALQMYAGAMLRHALALSDPTVPDLDPESGLSHAAHAGACALILLHHLDATKAPEMVQEVQAALGYARAAAQGVSQVAEAGELLADVASENTLKIRALEEELRALSRRTPFFAEQDPKKEPN